MSASDPLLQHTNKRKNASEKAALIAAVAGGMPQHVAAEHFGVHRNTAQRWCASVRQVDNLANPMRQNWKDSVRPQAQRAITNGLLYKRDPYKAANLGVTVLQGLGDLTSKVEVENDVRITIEWGTASSEPINVTPTPDSVEPQ